MYQNVVAVQAQRHAMMRIREVTQFHFAARFHIAYVTQQEFTRASSYYPIVFIEDKQQSSFRPVVLLGLQEGENLFVDGEGRWHAGYIPAIIRRYPFVLTATGNDQYVVCVDEGSGLLSETEGVPLFTAEGQPGPVLENVKRYLAELHQLEQLTIPFSRMLAELKLLVPLQLRLNDSGRMHTIAGCYVVNEAGLQGLTAEQFLALREKNYLPAIYAHMLSLLQVERLTTLRQERQKRGQAVAGAAEALAGHAAVAAEAVSAPQRVEAAAISEEKALPVNKTAAVAGRKVVASGNRAAPVPKAAGESVAKPARTTKKKPGN